MILKKEMLRLITKNIYLTSNLHFIAAHTILSAQISPTTPTHRRVHSHNNPHCRNATRIQVWRTLPDRTWPTPPRRTKHKLDASSFCAVSMTKLCALLRGVYVQENNTTARFQRHERTVRRHCTNFDFILRSYARRRRSVGRRWRVSRYYVTMCAMCDVLRAGCPRGGSCSCV